MNRYFTIAGPAYLVVCLGLVLTGCKGKTKDENPPATKKPEGEDTQATPDKLPGVLPTANWTRAFLPETQEENSASSPWT